MAVVRTVNPARTALRPSSTIRSPLGRTAADHGAELGDQPLHRRVRPVRDQLVGRHGTLHGEPRRSGGVNHDAGHAAGRRLKHGQGSIFAPGPGDRAVRPTVKLRQRLGPARPQHLVHLDLLG